MPGFKLSPVAWTASALSIAPWPLGFVSDDTQQLRGYDVHSFYVINLALTLSKRIGSFRVLNQLWMNNKRKRKKLIISFSNKWTKTFWYEMAKIVSTEIG